MKSVQRKYHFRLGLPKILQKNAYDCGVFLCAISFCVCHDIPVDTFREKHMNYFRNHIVLSCAKGELMNIISYPRLKKLLVQK